MKRTKVSIILPCRNEEKSVEPCLKKIKKVLKKNNIDGEIIVSDSSKDKSHLIARKLGAKVIKHDKKGYGNAYLEGFKHARYEYIFIADLDCTYDFEEIPRFIYYLEKGYDLIIGNRFKGRIEKGSMPILHRYLGNPLLSLMFRLFFKKDIKDVHCGMRAIKKNAYKKLKLRSKGMEFATEMMINASKRKLKIRQLPINYHKRIGRSKLDTFGDGFRHIKFMVKNL